MLAKQLFYMLPGDETIHGPEPADKLWVEVNEGRLTPNMVVSESGRDGWLLFTALTDDAFSPQVISRAAQLNANLAQAEQLYLKATFILNEIQAHISVYHGRNGEVEAKARYALEFVEEALRLMPRRANYLNTKAILLAEGLGRQEEGMAVLREAAEIAPDDVQIQQNLRNLVPSTSGCGTLFVLMFAVLSVLACNSLGIVRHWVRA
jgi:tetratricopeptide (TPR) repeat protein